MMFILIFFAVKIITRKHIRHSDVNGKNNVVVCQQGYYGNRCTGICSKNCFQSRNCDRFTGDCNRGCQQGWMGSKCDQRKTMFFKFFIFFIL